jgi:hypothetical protein
MCARARKLKKAARKNAARGDTGLGRSLMTRRNRPVPRAHRTASASGVIQT